MGATEEVGKVASSTVEVLRSQPLALALIVINIIFMIGAGLFIRDAGIRTDAVNARKDALMQDMIQKAYRCTLDAPKDDH
jgi:hypothetical protein